MYFCVCVSPMLSGATIVECIFFLITHFQFYSTLHFLSTLLSIHQGKKRVILLHQEIFLCVCLYHDFLTSIFFLVHFYIYKIFCSFITRWFILPEFYIPTDKLFCLCSTERLFVAFFLQVVLFHFIFFSLLPRVITLSRRSVIFGLLLPDSIFFRSSITVITRFTWYSLRSFLFF